MNVHAVVMVTGKGTADLADKKVYLQPEDALARVAELNRQYGFRAPDLAKSDDGTGYFFDIQAIQAA